MQLLPVQTSAGIKFGLQGGHDLIPGAITSPQDIPVINRLPWARALGNIAPRCAGVQLPEQAIEHFW